MKIKKILILLGVILIGNMFSCKKQDNNKDTLVVSDFNTIGEIHNLFLTNVEDNFIVNNNISNEEEKIDFINQFNMDFANSLNIYRSNKLALKTGLNENKSFINQTTLINRAFGDNSQSRIYDIIDSIQNKNIFELIEYIYNENIIGQDSRQILLSLANDLKSHYLGNLSDSDLKLNVESLINQFNSIGFEEGSEGEMVGTILAISKYSLQWWEERNENQISANLAAVPAWVGSDIVGGIISAAVAATGQAIVNGEIDWGTVAWSAAGGAISSSTGAVSKILSWIKN